MAKTLFKKEYAKPFLIRRARELELVPDKVPLSRIKDLVLSGLLPWSVETAERRLRGAKRYPIPEIDAEALRKRFQITTQEWSEITEIAGDETPETTLPAEISKFLAALPTKGLQANTALLPRGLMDADIAKFCVPARVITEAEWQGLPPESRSLQATNDASAMLAISRRVAGVLLNTWLKGERGHTVLFGEPGEGKTTALWLFVASECERWCSAVEDGKVPLVSRLPLVLPLRSIREGARDLLGLAIDASLQISGTPDVERSAVQSWLESQAREGRILLALDGFDELDPTQCGWLRKEISRLGVPQVLLTTRYHADPHQVLQGFQSLRMVPLRWWIIDEYIHRYFTDSKRGSNRANALRAELRATPVLRHLAQSPLLLAALCAAKDAGSAHLRLRNRADVLGRALRVLLARGDERRGHARPRLVRDEAKVRVLSEVAWRHFALGPVPMPEGRLAVFLDGEAANLTPGTPSGGDDLLHEFVLDGVFVRQGDGPYSFLLRRFHEYCLSLHLAKESKALPVAESAARFLARSEAWNRSGEWPNFRPLNHPAWREVLPLAAGVMEGDPSLVLAVEADWRLREDLSESRLRLLAEVLGEFLSGNEARPGTTEKLQELLQEVMDAVLDRVREEPVITSLVVSWRRTLAALPADLSVRALTERLRGSETYNHQSAYAMALGEVGTREAGEYLRLILTSKEISEKLKSNAAIALGLAGDEESRDCLLQVVTSDPHQYVFLGAINGLSQVADGKARAALADLLRNHPPDTEVVMETVRHCEILFGPEIEEALIELVESVTKLGGASPSSTDLDLIQDCAGVLGRIGRPETAKRLAQLLGKRLPERVKRSVYQAIAAIGDVADREFLRKRLDVRGEFEAAALALLSAGDATVLKDLLSVVSKHQSEDFREAVIGVVGILHSERVLTFLVQSLEHDKSERVRRSAAMALGRQGGPMALAALRQALTKETEAQIRLQCARGLASHGDPASEETLVLLTSDAEPPTTRFTAIAALAELSSKTATEALLRGAISEDSGSEFKRRCLDAMGRIQRRSGFRYLRKGGWESP